MTGMIPLLSISSIFLLYFRAAGDRRHDADRIAVFGGRVFLLQVTNILVIEVDIHEAANAAVIGVKVLAQIRVGSGKLCQGLPDSGRIELHACLLACKLPQGSRNLELYGHIFRASSVTLSLLISHSPGERPRRSLPAEKQSD